ncbi:hypothetical protein STA3757_27270 [Stanieria sp. NIES-3757]|nr:hypothetical protein STA3757_27270 [Stanieria sp. NIES-3757]
MKMILANLASELVTRIDGPLHFRLFLQPIMATLFAFRDGRRDAKEGRDPYGWTILTNPEHRRFLLQDGWKGISKVFILALVLDFIYQFIALRSLNLMTAVIVACFLSIIPYALLRGPFNRLIVLKSNKRNKH